MFRVSHRGEGIDDADTIESARGIVRGQATGRYDIDEISAEPLPSGHTSRRWGTAIRRPDGAVTIDPDPWPDSVVIVTFGLSPRQAGVAT
jgi:hypothetical protein